MLGTKKGVPWEKGGRGRPAPYQSFTYALVSQAWEGCYLPSTHPQGASQPLIHSLGVARGSSTWDPQSYFPKAPGSLGATLLKPPGLWERGMREERFPTPARVSAVNLDEQKLSMVL